MFAADFPMCQLSGLRWASNYSSHKFSAAMEFCDCSTKAEIINTKVLTIKLSKTLQAEKRRLK